MQRNIYYACITVFLCAGNNGYLEQDNRFRRDAYSPTRYSVLNDHQRINGLVDDNSVDSTSRLRRSTSSTADMTEEEYNTAGEETPGIVNNAPRGAPVSDAQYSTSSSSFSDDISYSTSSSTPLSMPCSRARLGRSDSIASAPPSTEWSTHAPVDLPIATPIATAPPVARTTALPDGLRLVPSTPKKSSGPETFKSPPARQPARKSNLNASPRPSRSLFCLSLSNPLRKLCIRIVEYKYPFSHKIMMR